MYSRIFFEICVFYLMIFYALNSEYDYDSKKSKIIDFLFWTFFGLTIFVFLLILEQNLLTKTFFLGNAICIMIAWIIIYASKQE